ncbi:MAG: peptide chain release factor N(5)-glutamine methyltransferase [Clostridia bacterium]|nr:peptide chain release factor N(5)-glutamine methyltransferase [Clostridia bacterium]
MNIKDLLIFGTKYLKDNNIDEANLKCKILLASILKVSKEYLIIHDLEELAENIVTEFKNKIEDIKNGKPIQYITNKQEFMGLNFYVNENVLIPQPDTEILVEEVISKMKQNISLTILDLCTGSGAIAISIAKNIDKLMVSASDISDKALEIAKKNAEANNVQVNFILSDMFENINAKYDCIVSNPPYIEDSIIKTLPKEVQNEPYIALAGGEDGLKFYRIIAENAKKFLNDNGFVAVEIGYNQKDKVIQIFENEGYKNIYSKKDFGGNDRIVIANI